MYDAIIVGLGPGGSVAAQILAEHGMRVLAFDKDYMPRYKPCGGAISARVSQVLAEDFSDVVEATIYGGEFRLDGVPVEGLDHGHAQTRCRVHDCNAK